MTIHQDDGNLYEVLIVINGRNVDGKGVCAFFFDRHHRPAVVGELHKDTAEQCNCTMKNIAMFITMPINEAVLSSIEMTKNSKTPNNFSSIALHCVSFLVQLLYMSNE